ncbi:MAG: type III pantothenate kinase [Planctomycetes bacterium]|nr:type III pantothenate kinase [Planctomycetota bacterium]
MRLIADCGNSTIKLGLAHDGGIWSHERLAPREDALSAFVQPHLRAIEELVVLPGSRAHAELLAAWWSRIAAGKPLRRIGSEIPVPALGQYATCGVDRVLAGLVACRQERRSLVVVDAGTATTLTAWRYDAHADPARTIVFLGGLIAPGAAACAAGLSSLAPALPHVEPLGPEAGACQHDTYGAIAAAIGIGHGPMILACLDRLRRESTIAEVIATGGGCGALIAAGAIPRLAYRPSLVLEGIEELCRAQTPGAR